MTRDDLIQRIELMKLEPEIDRHALAKELRRKHRIKLAQQRPWRALIGAATILLVVFQLNQIPIEPERTNWLRYAFIFSQVLIAAAILYTLRPRSTKTKLGMRVTCSDCENSISDSESALGDELWVGPERCPHCDNRYPVIE